MAKGEANGKWTITVIDSTHFDEQASAYVHAYTGGSPWHQLCIQPFYIKDVCLVGVPVYCPAYTALITITLKDGLSAANLLTDVVIRDALRGAMRQTWPVMITHPDGTQYKGHIRPAQGTAEVIDRYDIDNHTVKESHLTVVFLEAQ